MSLIDVKCLTCGEISEVYRAAADHPKTPACPKCDQLTEQIHLPASTRPRPPAVVVYQAPDGSYRFPGDTTSLATARYDRLGYKRVEARGWAEVRQLEKQIGGHEGSRMRIAAEHKQQQRERGEALRRSELRRFLDHGGQLRDGKGNLVTVNALNQFGRDLARVSLERTNDQPRERGGDPGFFVEAYSVDRSNREEARDVHGRRRRD